MTFALLHLSCMRVLAAIVPRELAGLAQAIYGTVGIGLTSAALTLISGSLYAEFGNQGFWAMFLMALAAVPAIWRLYRALISQSPARLSRSYSRPSKQKSRPYYGPKLQPCGLAFRHCYFTLLIT